MLFAPCDSKLGWALHGWFVHLLLFSWAPIPSSSFMANYCCCVRTTENHYLHRLDGMENSGFPLDKKSFHKRGRGSPYSSLVWYIWRRPMSGWQLLARSILFCNNATSNSVVEFSIHARCTAPYLDKWCTEPASCTLKKCSWGETLAQW